MVQTELQIADPWRQDELRPCLPHAVALENALDSDGNFFTEMALAGQSHAQIIAGVKAFGKKELPPLEPGAMCYIMSSRGSPN
jgi:hypothetical protein